MLNKLSKLPVGTRLRIKRDCSHYGRTYKKGDIVIKSPDPYHCCIEAIEMPTRRPAKEIICAFGIPYEDLEIINKESI